MQNRFSIGTWNMPQNKLSSSLLIFSFQTCLMSFLRSCLWIFFSRDCYSQSTNYWIFSKSDISCVVSEISILFPQTLWPDSEVILTLPPLPSPPMKIPLKTPVLVHTFLKNCWLFRPLPLEISEDPLWGGYGHFWTLKKCATANFGIRPQVLWQSTYLLILHHYKLLFVRYDMYLPLHELWKGYMQELLNLTPNRQVNKFDFLQYQPSSTL